MNKSYKDNPEKVYDCHLHTIFKVPVRESTQLFKREFEELGMEKVNFLSFPIRLRTDRDDLQNYRCLYYKARFSPNAYCYAGIIYDFTLTKEQMQADILRQAKEAMENGFDGFKMLESMPKIRKAVGFAVDSDVYEPFFNYMEKNGYPILMHIAHPREFWDAKRCPEHYMKTGSFYGTPDYLTFEQSYQEVYNVLDRHPNLKLTVAHWGFLVHDRAKFEQWFDKYPNTTMCTTPGGEQYIDMKNDDLSWWKKTIEKYSNRIFYGTDAYQFDYENEEEWLTCIHRRPDLVRDFFETDVKDKAYNEDKFDGIKLDKKYRDKIYRENFVKYVGEPKTINYEHYIEEITKVLEKTTDCFDKYDLKCIINDFMSIKDGKEVKI